MSGLRSDNFGNFSGRLSICEQVRGKGERRGKGREGRGKGRKGRGKGEGGKEGERGGREARNNNEPSREKEHNEHRYKIPHQNQAKKIRP